LEVLNGVIACYERNGTVHLHTRHGVLSARYVLYSEVTAATQWEAYNICI